MTGIDLTSAMASNGTNEASFFLDLSEDDGVIATHIEGIAFPKHVATSHDTDTGRNTLKEYLIALGCVNVPDGHFAFDSSFVEPHAKVRFIKLARLFDELTDKDVFGRSVFDPTPPLSIFGHADPVGQPDYNSILSARRAKAIYAVLIRDTKIWDDLFTKKHPQGGDVWGRSSIETMIQTVGFPNGTPASVQSMEPKQATSAIRNNGPLRRELFKKYMDFLCVRVVQGVEQEFRLEKDKHFLARGAGQNNKGDLQGCGEFNPTLILSKKKQAEFEKSKDKTQRNKENARNRRVLVFLFKPGSRIDPKNWPCPDVERGSKAVKICEKRFWPDDKARLAPDAEDDKLFRKELPKLRQDTFGGTFACRFYQGIAQDSPCEGIHKQWAVRVLRETPRLGEELKPLADKRFVALVQENAKLPDSPELLRIHGKTDSAGILRLPVFDERTTITLKLEAASLLLPKEEPETKEEKQTAPPTPEEEAGFLSFKLDGGALRNVNTGELPGAGDGSEENKKLAAKQRLYNLGYGKDRLEQWDEPTFDAAVKQFQKNERLADDKGLDDDTRAKLKEEHDPDLQKPPQEE